jgi:hypothetical protein
MYPKAVPELRRIKPASAVMFSHVDVPALDSRQFDAAAPLPMVPVMNAN